MPYLLREVISIADRVLPQIVRLALLATGAAATWLIAAFSYDPFFITGSTAPATIWRPDIGVEAVVAGYALLGAAAWRRGGTRLLLVGIWLLFVAFATHRLVEFTDGRVDDVWLTITIQRLEPEREHPEERRRCLVGERSARCTDRSGNVLYTASALPFVQLYPGAWTKSGTFPGHG